DARDDVDQAWRVVPPAPSLAAFKHEASKRDKLRQLFPYGGSFSLGFSRCTREPFTRDIPAVSSSGPAHFVVRDVSSQKVFGRGDAAYAATLVEALLPPDCGPAVSGTCDSL